jgi:hypothetical protein
MKQVLLIPHENLVWEVPLWELGDSISRNGQFGLITLHGSGYENSVRVVNFVSWTNLTVKMWCSDMTEFINALGVVLVERYVVRLIMSCWLQHSHI